MEPVAYGARGLTECEKRYSQIGCEKFHHYIFRLKRVILETDQKSLIALSQKGLTDMTQRRQRLMLKLQRYSYVMEWTPGRLLYLADKVWRRWQCRSKKWGQWRNGGTEGLPASNQQLQKIAEETAKDEVLLAVLRCITEGYSPGCPHNLSGQLRLMFVFCCCFAIFTDWTREGWTWCDGRV